VYFVVWEIPQLLFLRFCRGSFLFCTIVNWLFLTATIAFRTLIPTDVSQNGLQISYLSDYMCLNPSLWRAEGLVKLQLQIYTFFFGSGTRFNSRAYLDVSTFGWHNIGGSGSLRHDLPLRCFVRNFKSLRFVRLGRFLPPAPHTNWTSFKLVLSREDLLNMKHWADSNVYFFCLS
jgi:hypothetical protein